jgi:hypothetical protein
MKLINPSAERLVNIAHNASYTQEISKINDSYFKNKLEVGLCKYEPKIWQEGQLSPMDERELN